LDEIVKSVKQIEKRVDRKLKNDEWHIIGQENGRPVGQQNDSANDRFRGPINNGQGYNSFQQNANQQQNQRIVERPPLRPFQNNDFSQNRPVLQQRATRPPYQAQVQQRPFVQHQGPMPQFNRPPPPKNYQNNRPNQPYQQVGDLAGVGDLPVNVTPEVKGVLAGVGDLALVGEVLDKDLLLAAGSSLSDASPAM
jgi:hypothetical protein